ncbi:hypothetical protein NQ315_001396 [Exocentrus adspersus]|uniref:Coiled-coil domain-containing protein 167 n=1 Tax=Exocentrus adspersus TaxID=1586481 RepID=A0AAV8WEQ7_9CUCU|nr:hypothetical protein NQ315_001396 [Exocentrus adspersus]
MSFAGGCSIMEEITRTEEAIKHTYGRVVALERKLESETLPESRHKLLETELKEVRKLLRTHEDQLGHLRTHNRKTFIFVVALMFVIFSLYMFYVLVVGYDEF